MTRFARLLMIWLALFPAPLCWGATYYVSKDGNDANDGTQMTQGEGTVGPKLTIQAAYGLITEAATMHEIVVGSGTYEETAGAGYMSLGGVGVVGDIHCTIRSSTGNRDDVKITSSGTRTIRIHTTLADTAHIKLQDLTVEEDGTLAGLDFADTGSFLELENCRVITTNAAGNKGVSWGSSATTRRIRVHRCAFATTGNGVEVGTATTGGTPDVEITDSTFVVTGTASINAAIFAPFYWKGLRISGNTIEINKSANGCVGIYAGFDGGDSATPTTGSPVFANNTVKYTGAAVSHGILIGYGANGGALIGNTITNGNPAIVFKGDGCVITNNIFHGAGALLLKGAQRNTVVYNTCYTTSATAAIRIEQQASASLTGLTWTDATDTLSKVSTFVAYNSFRSGDYFQITAGANVTPEHYAVVSRNAADGIKLPGNAGSANSDGDVAGVLKHTASHNTIMYNIVAGTGDGAAIYASAALTDYVGGYNQVDYNLYWNTHENSKLSLIDGTNCTTLEEIQAAWVAAGSGRYAGTPQEHNDAHSLVAKPGFLSEDPTHPRFLHIRGDSPAARGRNRAIGAYQPATRRAQINEINQD
jgi:hypothetical protein